VEAEEELAPKEHYSMRAALRLTREPRVETILREVMLTPTTGWLNWNRGRLRETRSPNDHERFGVED
jgi:hypothetical protein